METDPASTRQQRFSVRAVWFSPTKCLVGLLVLQGALFFSEQYRWFPFNERQGWTVRIGIALVAGTLLVMAGWFAVRFMRRRSSQFDLATMLLLVAVLAVPCAWFVYVEDRIAEERLASKWVEDWQGAKECHAYWGMDQWNYRSSTDKAIVTMVGIDMPATMMIGRTSTAGWPPIYPQWLKRLLREESYSGGLRKARFGDRFPLGSIEDEQARPEKLYAGEEFDLNDGEMDLVGKLHELEQLTISSRKITDAGLRPLYSLRRLKSLTLVTPNVTPEAIAELRRNLPRCEVVIYDDVVEPAS